LHRCRGLGLLMWLEFSQQLMARRVITILAVIRCAIASLVVSQVDELTT
jgi:hypothetical protein